MKVSTLIFIGVSFAAVYGLSVHKEGERFKRVANGVDSKDGENLDFVSLSIRFYNQRQNCGGILIAPQFVLTTASCVSEWVEKLKSFFDNNFKNLKIVQLRESQELLTQHFLRKD